MYCIHCGKEIPDDAKFCIHCGKECATVPQKKQTYNVDTMADADVDVITKEDMQFKFRIKSNMLIVRILIVVSAVCCLLPFVTYHMGSIGIYRYTCNGFEYMVDTTLFSYADELVKIFMGLPWILTIIAILYTIVLAIGSFFTASGHHRFDYWVISQLWSLPYLYLFAIIYMYIFKAIVSNASPNTIAYPEPAFGLWLAFLLQIACAIYIWPDVKFAWKVGKAQREAKRQSQNH